MANVEYLVLVVRDLERALGLYERGLGFARVEEVSDVPAIGARRIFLRAENCLLELLEPHDETKPPGAFLSARGEGVFGLGVRSADTEETLAQLRRAGVAAAGPTGGGGGEGEYWYLRPADAHGVLVEVSALGAPPAI